MSEINLYHCVKCGYSGNRPLTRCPKCGAYDSLTAAMEIPQNADSGQDPANSFLSCPYCRTSYLRTFPKCHSCGASSPLTQRVQIGKPGLAQPAGPKAESLPNVTNLAKASGCATALKVVLIGFAALVIIFFLLVCVIAFMNVASPAASPEPGGALLRFVALALRP